MRSPSAKVLINRVDIFPATRGPDRDGGPVYTYGGLPGYLQVPCTVQAGSIAEVIDQDRVTQYLEYRIMFGSQQTIRPRDKIEYTDPSGTAHTLFAEAQRDEAGRGAAFTVRAVERL